MGVGLFSENAGGIHTVASLITFLFGGLSAIVSYEVGKPPFSCLSIVLGAAGLVALVLFGLGVYLGIGHGGMERMIAYPILLWGVGFGSHLIAYSKEAESASKT
jgi:hypothetical membrane protein